MRRDTEESIVKRAIEMDAKCWPDGAWLLRKGCYGE
jgi:hypothetical protein